MTKLAKLFGIDSYESEDFETLYCCVNDAKAMAKMLNKQWSPSSNMDDATNYASRVRTSADKRISTDYLRAEVKDLMSRPMGDGDVLFYFSGHGVVNEKGGFLVTQDGTKENPGYPMQELLDAANQSGLASVVIILDCCNSGQIGNNSDGEGFDQVSIGPNVTILAASGATQQSKEEGKHSLFTRRLLEAFSGGAADCRGEVSASSIYAYVEQALGPWDQRPVYKSYARKLNAIRRCKPAVPDQILDRLTQWFPLKDSEFRMDKSYEEDAEEHAIPEHVEVFQQFKKLRDAGLLEGERIGDKVKDLYYVAMEELTVHLTPQGRLLWSRAKRGDFKR